MHILLESYFVKKILLNFYLSEIIFIDAIEYILTIYFNNLLIVIIIKVLLIYWIGPNMKLFRICIVIFIQLT